MARQKNRGGRSKLHPSAAPSAEYLGAGDGAPTLRTIEERRLPQESRPPQDQDILVDNEGNVERDTKHNAERVTRPKPIAVSPISQTGVISDPPSSDTTLPTTGRSVVSLPSTPAASARAATLGRPKSPVKAFTDLAVTSKFLTLRSLDRGVPGDVRNLFEKLHTISYGESLVPAAVAIDNVTQPNIDELGDVIAMAQEISQRANNLTEEGHSELSWNCEVHSPILRLGLARLDRVRHFNM